MHCCSKFWLFLFLKQRSELELEPKQPLFSRLRLQPKRAAPAPQHFIPVHMDSRDQCFGSVCIFDGFGSSLKSEYKSVSSLFLCLVGNFKWVGEGCYPFAHQSIACSVCAEFFFLDVEEPEPNMTSRMKPNLFWRIFFILCAFLPEPWFLFNDAVPFCTKYIARKNTGSTGTSQEG